MKTLKIIGLGAALLIGNTASAAGPTLWTVGCTFSNYQDFWYGQTIYASEALAMINHCESQGGTPHIF